MTPWKLRQACHMVHNGGIIAYPTEAVYGLGCSPYNRSAVLQLLQLKQRPLSKGLILIAANIEQLLPFIQIPSQQLLDKAVASWPGPITWIFPAQPHVPQWLRGSHCGIAVRISEHPIASQLCQQLGHALISTSANINQQNPARSALTVRRYFGNSLNLTIHGALGENKQPTQIRDLCSNAIIRSS